jgi:hypothetical protein
MTRTRSDLPHVCTNCYVQLLPRAHYCHGCGQDTHRDPPTVWEFAHELVTHYVALEGKLWRTLGRLFFSPGYLTRVHLDGRRRRYLEPLRLYLSVSILFFIALKFSAEFVVIAVGPEGDASPRAAAEVAGVSVVAPPAAESPVGAALMQLLAPVGRSIRQRVAGMSQQEAGRFVGNWAVSHASYAMFFLLPVYAALNHLVYWRRRLSYGVHLLFALHAHAFLFAVLALLTAPWPPAAILVVLLIPLYFVAAMQRVYGGRWWATLARAGVVAVAYALALVIAVIGLTTSVALAGLTPGFRDGPPRRASSTRRRGSHDGRGSSRRRTRDAVRPFRSPRRRPTHSLRQGAARARGRPRGRPRDRRPSST